jgi:hypothetical protein
VFDGEQWWIVVLVVLLPCTLACIVTIFGVMALRRVELAMETLYSQAHSIERKVDIVHDATNSRLHRIEEELRVATEALTVALGKGTGEQPAQAGVEGQPLPEQHGLS